MVSKVVKTVKKHVFIDLAPQRNCIKAQQDVWGVGMPVMIRSTQSLAQRSARTGPGLRSFRLCVWGVCR